MQDFCVCPSSEVSSVALRMRGYVIKVYGCEGERNTESVMFYLLLTW